MVNDHTNPAGFNSLWALLYGSHSQTDGEDLINLLQDEWKAKYGTETTMPFADYSGPNVNYNGLDWMKILESGIQPPTPSSHPLSPLIPVTWHKYLTEHFPTWGATLPYQP